MENNRPCRSFINRKSIALLAALALMVGTGADVASAKTAKEINTSVNACLDRFYKEINGGKELAGKAKGVLVLPGVIKAGLIAGGEYGEGALRVAGKTASYYDLTAGSVGFQIGGDTKDIIIMFMTDAALKQFQVQQGLGGRGRRQRRPRQHRRRRAHRFHQAQRSDCRLCVRRQKPDGRRFAQGRQVDQGRKEIAGPFTQLRPGDSFIRTFLFLFFFLFFLFLFSLSSSLFSPSFLFGTIRPNVLSKLSPEGISAEDGMKLRRPKRFMIFDAVPVSLFR